MAADFGPFDTEDVFKSAVTIVQNLPKQGPIKTSNEVKLNLYAYFKQATCGPSTSKPGYNPFKDEYWKIKYWNKLGDMTKEEAMKSYVKELRSVMDALEPKFSEKEARNSFGELLKPEIFDFWFKQ